MAEVFLISYPAPLIFKNGESPDIRHFSTKDGDVFLLSNEILYIAGAIYAEFPLFWESYNDYFLAYKFARA